MPLAHVPRAKAVSPDDSRLVINLFFCWEKKKAIKRANKITDGILVKKLTAALHASLTSMVPCVR